MKTLARLFLIVCFMNMSLSPVVASEAANTNLSPAVEMSAEEVQAFQDMEELLTQQNPNIVQVSAGEKDGNLAMDILLGFLIFVGVTVLVTAVL